MQTQKTQKTQTNSSPDAVRRVLQLLARRPRTEHELRSALAAAFSTAETNHAVARMRALRYLDDAAWAANYVASERAQERAARLLRRELLARGISADDADAALSGHDDHASALRAARRRLRALRRTDPRRRTRRLRDYLGRRGFNQSAVQSALARLIEHDLSEESLSADEPSDDSEQPGKARALIEP